MSQARLDPPARVLVTKIGLDGHDRGSRIVAAFLRDAGMDVIYTPPWQSIPAVVKLAMEEDVDAIGVSSLATDHLIVPAAHSGAARSGARPCWRRGRRHRARRRASVADRVRGQRRLGPRRLARRDRRPHRRACRGSARGARRRTAGMDIMTKEAVQLPLPGFDQAFGQWRADYASQIALGSQGRQSLRHRGQAALYASRLGRLSLRSRSRLSGTISVHARNLSDDAPRAHLDAAPVDRAWHARGL